MLQQRLAPALQTKASSDAITLASVSNTPIRDTEASYTGVLLS